LSSPGILYGSDTPRREVLDLPRLWGSRRVPNTQGGFILGGDRWSVCVAGTKSGKTLGCAVWIVALAWEHPRQLFGWFAPSYRQALIGFRLCAALLPERRRRANESDLTITLANGSVMEFKTTEKPELLYGPSYRAVVVDEASRMRGEAWPAIRSTLTVTRGPAKIVANARGKKNWFYQRCKAAQRGTPAHSFHKIRTRQNPHIAPEEIEDARRTLPLQKYRELYEAEFFEEAANLFPGWSALLRPIRPDPVAGREYLAAMDLGKARDYCALLIGDVASGEMVFFDRWQKIAWPASVARAAALIEPYGNPDLWVDETGMGGQVVLDYMREQGLPVRGVTFTNEFKEVMVSQFQLAVEKKQIAHAGWEVLDEELDSLDAERLPSGRWRYAAPEGSHDDAAWAAMIWNHARLEQTGLGGHAGQLAYLQGERARMYEEEERERRGDEGHADEENVGRGPDADDPGARRETALGVRGPGHPADHRRRA